MAAPLRKTRQQEVRQKIQASQIITRLTKHVMGKVDMQPSQVTAALGLLKKTLPDLTATELSGTITTHEQTLDALK